MQVVFGAITRPATEICPIICAQSVILHFAVGEFSHSTASRTHFASACQISTQSGYGSSPANRRCLFMLNAVVKQILDISLYVEMRRVESEIEAKFPTFFYPPVPTRTGIGEIAE